MKPLNPSDSNRREFLKTAAVVGATAFVVGRGAWADETTPTSKSPNEKANIACIGVGGKGNSDSNHIGDLANVVAIVDIDEDRLNKKKEQFPKAKAYNDYRKMFDEMSKSIDGVTVSTPDHHHAIASTIALNLGKNVYCQKPLTHTVAECRRVRELAAEKKVVTQMGNQGTATNGLRRGVEILRAEALGPVKEVHVWTDRPIWPQAPGVTSRPPEAPVPKTVHWDNWIGPAPMRPYAVYDEGGKHKGAYHDFNWRGWWDFGTGALGDMACHTANMPFMGLDLGYPTSIEAKCGDLNDETYPSWATIVYHFPARGSRPAVKLTWWEGHKNPQTLNLPETKTTLGFEIPRKSASLVVGEKASMFSLSDYGEALKVVTNGDGEGIKIDVPQTLPRHGKDGKGFDQDFAQKAEWIAAFSGGSKPLSNFNYAGMLAEFVLLGNIAIRMQGEKLEWDGPNMKFTNNEKANSYLTKQYREGWKLS